nr:unnamed protein product [Callosobruchus analis]
MASESDNVAEGTNTSVNDVSVTESPPLTSSVSNGNSYLHTSKNRQRRNNLEVIISNFDVGFQVVVMAVDPWVHFIDFLCFCNLFSATFLKKRISFIINPAADPYLRKASLEQNPSIFEVSVNKPRLKGQQNCFI